MANLNGLIIMEILKNIEEPATETEIATQVTDVVGIEPKAIAESVKETLNGGVRYGYIQQVCGKYVAPRDEDDDDDDAVEAAVKKDWRNK